MLLRKSIPELYHFDDSNAQQMFHSKYYPALKYFIQTGFDQQVGCLNYKHMKVTDPVVSLVDATAEKTTNTTPLYFKITASGAKVSAGPLLTHDQVLSSGSWPFASKLINREYIEV